MSASCRSSCCRSSCCHAGPRGMTVFFAVVGLLISAAVIVPPVYVHETDQDYKKLFPVLKYGRIYLEEVTRNFHGTTMERYNNDSHFNVPPSREETYKLAIFQLLDDTERMAPYLAFTSFVIGSLNIPLDLLLLGGALFRQSCGLLPWIIITLIEHIVMGVPLIIFFGLISLYLAAQLHLYVVGAALIITTITVFCVSMSSWFTVVSCYNMFRRPSTSASIRPSYLYDEDQEDEGCCGMRSSRPSGNSGLSHQSRRPLLHNGSRPRSVGGLPNMPAGHPAASSKRFCSQQQTRSSSLSSRQLPPIPT